MRRGRIAVVVLLLGLVGGGAAGCSEDSGDDGGEATRTIEVPGVLTGDAAEAAGAVPEAEVDTSSPSLSLQSVIVEAPSSVSVDEEFTFVVELRNPSASPMSIEPCWDFVASFGESSTVAVSVGTLPCDEIGDLGPGERVRLSIPMTAPEEFVTGEGGYLAGLRWKLIVAPEGPSASIPLRMEP